VSTPFLPPIQPYHPITFQERGVVIPFTTPLLGGTRARPSATRGLELVIPNPSGLPGVYVMEWRSIPALCRPTLHDRHLSERIASVYNITPSIIRDIARDVAVEGLAGEDARRAALASAGSDKHDRTVTNFMLLMALVAQVGLFRNAPKNQPDAQTRARQTVAHIAPQIERSVDWVATALESLGDAMAIIGVEGQPDPGRVPRLMDILRGTCAGLKAWSGPKSQEDRAAYVQMVCSAADYTLLLAEECVARARALTTDLTGLLKEWAADPRDIANRAARAEWLLDGWEQICLIWRCAQDDPARMAALMEIAMLVPIIPREAKDWTGATEQIDPAMRLRRTVPLNQDWRTGATVFDLIARNEYIRAAAC
jgi:hypothetical protein